MTLRLLNSSAVIVAQHFNPSVVGQLWLVKNELVAESDFRPGCVFTDFMVQVQSRQFALMLTMEQCQFSPQTAPEEEQDLAIEKLGKFVRVLPHTPFQAIGVNFQWQLAGPNDAIVGVGRRAFFVEGSPLHQAFDCANARFGGYLSKDALGCRLKLHVHPSHQDAPDGGREEMLNLAFNYHLDVAKQEDPARLIEQMLGNWNEAKKQSFDITALLAGSELIQ